GRRAPRRRSAGVDGDRQRVRGRGGAPGGARAGHGGGARGAGPGAAGAAGPHARGGVARDVHHLRCSAARRAGRSHDREADRTDHRRGRYPRAGGAGRGGGAPQTVAMNTVARPVVLLACLAGCFHGPVAPPPPVAEMPFDPYGGAIYVPAIVNGDSAWLMFDTGLSRTGLDRDWAKSVGATAASDTGATAVVRSLRLGDLQLDRYRTALYPLVALREPSGRLLQGLLGHDVLHRFVVEIDYPTRRVRLFDATSYR